MTSIEALNKLKTISPCYERINIIETDIKLLNLIKEKYDIEYYGTKAGGQDVWLTRISPDTNIKEIRKILREIIEDEK